MEGGHTWRFSIRDGLQGSPGQGKGRSWGRESWNPGTRGHEGSSHPQLRVLTILRAGGGAWPCPPVANCSCPFLLCPHGRLLSVLAAPLCSFGTISCWVLAGATSLLPFSRVLNAPECAVSPGELTPVALTAWACWGSLSCPPPLCQRHRGWPRLPGAALEALQGCAEHGGADGTQLGTRAAAVVDVTHGGFGALNKPPQTVPEQGRPPALRGEAEHGDSSPSSPFPWAPRLEAELELPGSVKQPLRWPRAVPPSLWPSPSPERSRLHPPALLTSLPSLPPW